MLGKLFKRKTEVTPSQERACELGRKASQLMTRDMIGYVESRLSSICPGFLEVFRQQLEKIHNVPNHTPKTVANVELKIFTEHAEEAMKKLKVETWAAHDTWRELADKEGFRGIFDELIDKKISEAHANLLLNAALMMADAVEKGEGANARG